MVSNDLKNIREQKRYTQEQLAREINCTLRTIQKIERNNGYNPSIEIVLKISKVLNTPIEKIFNYK